MNEKNRNLLIRFASAAALLPGVLFLLFKGGYWAAALLGLGGAICLSEYYSMVMKPWPLTAVLGVALAAAMPAFPVWRPEQAWTLMFAAVAGVFFLGFVDQLLRTPTPEAPAKVAHLAAGLLYVGSGFTALSAVRAAPGGAYWAFGVLAISWLNDTGAYFAGRFLGRHKLYPRVSPSKTWEGFLGGMIASVLGMFGTKLFLFPGLTVADCLAVGVLGGILGPLGDLCESMLKRACQVKDSGFLMPGHGGFLDRVDALLFNAPAVLLYLTFFR